MAELKFFLVCFLIAAPLAALEELPDDSPFEEGVLSDEDYVYSLMYYGGASVKTPDFLTCHDEAISNGAHYFAYDGGYCHTMKLRFPFCRSKTKGAPIYIRKEYHSAGSPSDNAVLDSATLNAKFSSTSLRNFRIEAPTILNFPAFYQKARRLGETEEDKKNYFYMAGDDGTGKVDQRILADPSCHTNSSCGAIFITSSPEFRPQQLKVLHEFCGQTISLNDEPEINIFSHEGIGCKFFPDPYPESECAVTLEGDGELTINATLVGFNEGQCDGYSLNVVTYASDNSEKVTDLCAPDAPTMSVATRGRARIDFDGASTADRERYGFIINVVSN